jgi:F0F1-type ATP synthase gamma subunit
MSEGEKMGNITEAHEIQNIYETLKHHIKHFTNKNVANLFVVISDFLSIQYKHLLAKLVFYMKL